MEELATYCLGVIAMMLLFMDISLLKIAHCIENIMKTLEKR